MHIGAIGFRVMEPPIGELAHWLARQVAAPAASYAALASWLDVPIAITDERLRQRLRTLPVAD